MQTFTTRKRRGFTLIELLVVVLILSILMAVALPLYLSAVSDAQKKTCRANMQTIANAVQAGRVRTPAAADYSAWIGEALPVGGAVPLNLNDLNAVPACPSSGTYSIALGNAPGTFKIACTATGHGTFQPGVDSN